MAKSNIDVSKHALVPKHSKLSEKEKKELLEKYNSSVREFPKILKKDPAISHLDVSHGDMIKITRKSYTSGESVFYRAVLDE
ncbi:MAG: DNA-directed RNA polymerase subunit H [Candidatus Woesearchaeota archaeon]|nr:DNA-directed RNA polymerase subunit H [Candidatus Woesearchaeota archaeon]